MNRSGSISRALVLSAIVIPASLAWSQGTVAAQPDAKQGLARPQDLPKDRPQGRPQSRPQGRPPGSPVAPPNALRGKFPPAFEQLSKMPPEERNKALENNRQFRKMSSERQAQVRERLQNFSEMPAEQKQLMRDRFTILNSMPVENRERIREVFPRWRKLPVDRRQAMREEFRALSEKSSTDREKRFADPEFQKAFGPHEQKLLKDLSGLIR